MPFSIKIETPNTFYGKQDIKENTRHESDELPNEGLCNCIEAALKHTHYPHCEFSIEINKEHECDGGDACEFHEKIITISVEKYSGYGTRIGKKCYGCQGMCYICSLRTTDMIDLYLEFENCKDINDYYEKLLEELKYFATIENLDSSESEELYIFSLDDLIEFISKIYFMSKPINEKNENLSCFSEYFYFYKSKSLNEFLNIMKEMNCDSFDFCLSDFEFGKHHMKLLIEGDKTLIISINFYCNPDAKELFPTDKLSGTHSKNDAISIIENLMIDL